MGQRDKPRLASKRWDLLVLDEGHRLKNSNCKLNGVLASYRVSHKLLLTGTPIQNNMAELWSLLNFLVRAPD